MSPNDAHNRIAAKLHQLNSRIQANPQQKLTTLTEFYRENVDDTEIADIVLVVRSMVAANPHQDEEVNRTRHLREAKPLLMVAMVIMATLGMGCIAGGIYAFHLNAMSQTEVSVLGLHLKSTSSGVVAIVVGIVMVLFSITKTIKRTEF